VMQSGPVAVVPADSVAGMTADLLRALPRNVTAGAYAIGVGTLKTGAQGIFASYAEAQRSLALGAILQPTELVYLYDELKLFDLFSAGDQVDAFVNEVLGAVLRHDRRDGRLIATLNVLFGAALNRKVAARRLGVHPNTLTYRIRRLEELLGGSLLSGEFCFRVQLALKLAPLASRPAPDSPG
jgi:DNA-binding PucR family transcriptional regulator